MQIGSFESVQEARFSFRFLVTKDDLLLVDITLPHCLDALMKISVLFRSERTIYV
jgi:hypothetical protein